MPDAFGALNYASIVSWGVSASQYLQSTSIGYVSSPKVFSE